MIFACRVPPFLSVSLILELRGLTLENYVERFVVFLYGYLSTLANFHNYGLTLLLLGIQIGLFRRIWLRTLFH